MHCRADLYQRELGGLAMPRFFATIGLGDWSGVYHAVDSAVFTNGNALA